MTTQQKRTLIDITEDMRALDDLLEEAGGDVTDESVSQYVEKVVGEIEQDFNEKVDGYVAYIRHLELQAAARQEEAERLKKAADASKNAAKHLKDRLKVVMEMNGRKKAGFKRTATVAGNGGKVPIEYPNGMPEGEQVPGQYRRIKIEVDTDALRADLEEGKDVGFAKLGERGTHLRIK